MSKTTAFPDLKTKRLTLRELTLQDTDFIFKQFSDEDVSKYLYDAEPLMKREEAEEIITWYQNPEGKRQNRWGITNNEDGVIMGTCGYHNWDKTNNIAEIGYDLAVDFWGQGIMYEALVAVLDNGFGNMGLNRIQAFVAVDNKRSTGILEKLGFKCEGIIRDKHLFRGNYYDHYCFSLLKKEWNNK